MEQGPLIESLLRHLINCPDDFLAAPRLGSQGVVEVAAVVSDLLRELGGEALNPEQASRFGGTFSAQQQNRLQVILIGCWLLHEPWFRQRANLARPARAWLTKGLDGLSEMVSAKKLISDPDRREELVRLCLNALALCPAGETEAQAQDRLSTLDSVERQRVMRASAAAEQKRQREIRERLEREEAERAVPKYTRE